MAGTGMAAGLRTQIEPVQRMNVQHHMYIDFTPHILLHTRTLVLCIKAID